jgi:hypothetical protein
VDLPGVGTWEALTDGEGRGDGQSQADVFVLHWKCESIGEERSKGVRTTDGTLSSGLSLLGGCRKSYVAAALVPSFQRAAVAGRRQGEAVSHRADEMRSRVAQRSRRRLETADYEVRGIV